MMKKFNLAALVAVSMLGLVGCNTGTPATTSTTPQASEKVAAAVKDAMTLDRDALMKKAAEELGTNKLKILAVTSRGGKPAALKKFHDELAKYGTVNDNPVEYSSTVDGRIYTTLAGEIESGTTGGVQGAILQDGYQLQKKFIDTGYFTNYIPKEWKAESTTQDSDSDPFTLQFNFKTFMYNNKGLPEMKIDNIWDVTAEKYKGKLYTMDPANENVNMDWLIQLTDDKWNNVIKDAYNDATNDNKMDLTKFESYGEKKYAYAWIAGFLNNASFFGDDGKAVDALAKTPGSVGWIVYSKIQNVKETAETTKKNIVIAALGNEHSDGTNPGTSKVKGFGGFMYKHYMSIMPNATYPYATCAFFNILSTTTEGYSAWATDVGDYPTMTTINQDRTMNGHGTLATEANKDGIYKFTQDKTKENVFPCLNDPSSIWWNDSSKGNAVIETPSYIATYYNRVAGFINTQISNKK